MMPWDIMVGQARQVRPARVLVAEDGPVGRELMTALLERLGYTAVVVADAELALAAVRQNPPDLALSDISIAGMGGFELCRRLKANPTTRLIPVILVTGIGEEFRRAGIEAGADEFLAKPVSLKELRLRLARQLQRV
ncbi:MAG: response regulator [Candidatus Methylomirabilota bacterium]